MVATGGPHLPRGNALPSPAILTSWDVFSHHSPCREHAPKWYRSGKGTFHGFDPDQSSCGICCPSHASQGLSAEKKPVPRSAMMALQLIQQSGWVILENSCHVAGVTCLPLFPIQRHGYCTLGEAFNRLDFSTAILDSRRFNYVVRVSLKSPRLE